VITMNSPLKPSPQDSWHSPHVYWNNTMFTGYSVDSTLCVVATRCKQYGLTLINGSDDSSLCDVGYFSCDRIRWKIGIDREELVGEGQLK